MADNPFYPGYIPDSDVPQPLYPGYYPGQPQPRRPHGGGGMIKPVEYNNDDLFNIIDAVGNNIQTVGLGFPGWVKDRIVDDWKQTLKANIRPVDVNPEDLDDYDPNALPGAFGIGVDLNLADWKEDPGKMAFNTVKNWVDAGVNYGDIERRLRSEVWNTVTSDDLKSSAGGRYVFGDTEEKAVRTLGGALGATVNLQYEPTNNPLSLKNRGVYAEHRRDVDRKLDFTLELDDNGNVKNLVDAKESAMKKIDVYKEFGKSLSKFEMEGGYGPKREGLYNNVLFNGYRAAYEDLRQMADEKSDRYNPEFAKIAKSKEYAHILDVAEANLDVYQNMAEIGDSLKHPDFGYISSLEKEAIKRPLFLSGGLDLKSTKGKVKRLEEQMQAMDDKIADLRSKGYEEQADFIEKHVAGFKRQTDELIKNTTALNLAQQLYHADIDLKNNAITQSEFDAIQQRLSTQFGAVTVRDTINQLKTNVNGGFTGIALSGASNYIPGRDQTFLRNFAMVNKPGRLGGNRDLGHLMIARTEMDKNAPEAIIFGALNYIDKDAQIGRDMDIFTTIKRGKVTEKWLWPIVTSHMQAYTPAAYTTEFLKKHNYMGLIYEKKESDFEPERLARTFGKAPLNPINGNWFTVKGEMGGRTFSARFYGGAHFEAVPILYNMTKDKDAPLTAAALAHLLRAGDEKYLSGTGAAARLVADAFSDKNFSKIQRIQQRLNKNSEYYKELLAKNNGLAPNLGNMDDKDLRKFLNNLPALKKWLDDNAYRVHLLAGLKPGTDEYYAALIVALGKLNTDFDFKAIGILKKYSGPLQKVFYGLNRLQTRIIQSKVLKPFLKLFFIKNTIKDKVSSVIAKIFAASAASSGVLAPISFAIERAARLVINITIDELTEIGKVVLDTLTKADLDAMFKYIDKTVMRISRAILTILAILFLLFAVPSQKFFATVATGFSPVDNTKIFGITDNWLVVPRGSAVEVLSSNSRPSTVDSCFNFTNSTDQISLDSDGNMITVQLGGWESQRGQFDEGLKIIKRFVGGYFSRLCEDGPISLLWAPPNGQTGLNGNDGIGWCGYVTSQVVVDGNATIILGGKCDFSGKKPGYMAYLLAHESMHLFQIRLGGYDSAPGQPTFDDVLQADGGTLPTYPIQLDTYDRCSKNGSPDEDYAETLADFISPNTTDCPDSIWTEQLGGDPAQAFELLKNKYPAHYNYFINVLTRP